MKNILSACPEGIHVDITALHKALVDVAKPILMEDNKDKTDNKKNDIGDCLAE